MDRANGALRSARRESEERRDPLEIFREFIDHLGRVSRRQDEKSAKAKSRRGGK